MFSYLCRFIPQKLNNRILLAVLELFRTFGRLFGNRKLKKGRLKQAPFFDLYAERELTICSHLGKTDADTSFIEDQHSYSDVSYGVTTMAYAGCEIFALYNAMKRLCPHMPISLPQMITDFEEDGILWSGRFGTSPIALSDYLQKHGFQTRLCTKDLPMHSLLDEYDVFILTMYNNAFDLRDEIHTVCVTHEPDGFIAHNVYCNGSCIGPFPSFDELIGSFHEGRSKAISLIGISKN